MDRLSIAQQYASRANLAARIGLHQRCSANPHGLQRWVFEALELAPRARVLEIGCGMGSLWHENLDRLPDDLDLVLSDPSSHMLDATRDALRGTPAQLVCCALPELPFADGSFDHVVANHMLYHVDELQRGLHDIRRVLRPGGTLLAATNGVTHLNELKDLMRLFAIDGTDVSASFTLENGEAQLRGVFPQIRRTEYVDALRVKDPDLVLDYLASISTEAAGVVAARRATLRSAIQARMRDGVFHVMKSTGAFSARKD